MLKVVSLDSDKARVVVNSEDFTFAGQEVILEIVAYSTIESPALLFSINFEADKP